MWSRSTCDIAKNVTPSEMTTQLCCRRPPNENSHAVDPTNLSCWTFSYCLCRVTRSSLLVFRQETLAIKKALGATQTLRAGCSNRRSQKLSPHRRPPSRGAGWPKFNQLEIVTIFTYKPSLVRIDARNFELSW